MHRRQHERLPHPLLDEAVDDLRDRGHAEGAFVGERFERIQRRDVALSQTLERLRAPGLGCGELIDHHRATGGKIGRHAAHHRGEVGQVPRQGSSMHRHGADPPLLHVAQHPVELE